MPDQTQADRPSPAAGGSGGAPARLADRLAAAAGRQPRPVERWDPPDCGHSGMRIAADGCWYHEGAPIVRPELVRLFASVLRREADGGYVLVTPVEKLAIDVEDAPFVAVDFMTEGEGRSRQLLFTTNVGDEVIAGPANPLRFAEQPRGGGLVPYVRVRGGLDARVSRAAFYRLADLAIAEGGAPPGLWSGGAFFAFEPA